VDVGGHATLLRLLRAPHAGSDKYPYLLPYGEPSEVVYDLNRLLALDLRVSLT